MRAAITQDKITYGYRLHYIWLQARCEQLLPKTKDEHLRDRGGKGARSDRTGPGAHRVAGWSTYGCRLECMRLQAAVHTVAGKRSDGLSDFERALAG